jgi:hypothetical protein
MRWASAWCPWQAARTAASWVGAGGLGSAAAIDEPLRGASDRSVVPGPQTPGPTRDRGRDGRRRSRRDRIQLCDDTVGDLRLPGREGKAHGVGTDVEEERWHAGIGDPARGERQQ